MVEACRGGEKAGKKEAMRQLKEEVEFIVDVAGLAACPLELGFGASASQHREPCFLSNSVLRE